MPPPNSLRSFPAAADLAALMANCGLTDYVQDFLPGYCRLAFWSQAAVKSRKQCGIDEFLVISF